MVKTIGYISLLISCMLFGMIFILPFFDLTKSQFAGITTILIIGGEIFFYLSLFILGRSFLDKIKIKLKFRKGQKDL
jgi:hypothetical protein